MGEWKGIERLAINVARESCAPDFALEILRNALLRELEPLLKAGEAMHEQGKPLLYDTEAFRNWRKAVERWK